MRSVTSPMLALAMLSVLWLAPGCASKERLTPIFPPVADLAVEPKPQLDPAAVESEAALLAHDVAIEGWGERGWLQIARICRWAKANGAPVECEARLQ